MKSLNIVHTLDDSEISDSLIKFLESLPALKIVDYRSQTEANKIRPEIVIVRECDKNGAIYDILTGFKEKLPESAIFLISKRLSAEHVVRSIKAGASEYFTLPLDFDKLRKSIEEVRTHASAHSKENSATVYSFISSKGGLGTSVLAVNLAVAFASQNTTVALCDLGLQTGDSTILLDMAPKTTMADLCRNFQRLDAALLKNSMTTHESGVELLAPPRHPRDGEEIQAEQVKTIIDYLPSLYQKTIIDCPSSCITDSTAKAMGSSDKIFIVLDLSVPAIRNAVKLTEEIKRIGIGGDHIDYIVNRFTKNSAISVKEADKNLGKPAFWIIPNAYDDVFASVTSGIPVVSGSPRSPFGKNLKRFAERLSNNELGEDFRGISNLFGRAV
jgi:pilus assembly protein CpaE